ncbi:MAG: transposase domain-containing protein, partial [Chloroflexi bacterium]|nr:transposase domain-containing protein [Chloroflexota bacterium]
MPIMVRQLDALDRLSEQQLLGMAADLLPPSLLAEIADAHLPATRRDRKLPAELALLLPLAMNLWDDDSLELVLYKLLAGLRLVWPDRHLEPASKGGISQARYRVGARPLAALFHRV